MNWWQYLLLVNIYLVLFFSFYVLLLKQETFFQLNRVFLIAGIMLSFFIPLIQADWIKNLFITQQVQYTIYASPVILIQASPIRETHFTIGQVLCFMYIAGALFFTIKFIWQLFALKRMINGAQSAGPYSFFKKINVRDAIDNHELINAHEHVHANQWHSADVLLVEAVIVINWFNPVVYLYRRAVKHIHEFIADRQALNSGVDKSDYAMLLLNQTFSAPGNHLVNSFFNHSLLKQRIMMLQKNKSQRLALIKYGLSAPLFMLMLILSSATINNSKTIKFINKHAQQVLSAPANAPGFVGTSVSEPVKADKVVITTVPEKPSIAEKPSDMPQKDTTVDKKIFTSVEQVPEFPGGMQAFGSFLSKNIKYPEFMRKNAIEGKVITSFIVEKDGSLTDIKIVRAIGNGADEEALRVLKMSPKWTPGIQNGKPVRVSYTVPISFALNGKPVSNAGNLMGAVNGNTSNAVSITNVTLKTDSAKSKQTLVFNGQNDPLIILDGKEIPGISIKLLNSDDIQRMEVIKDKSAIALYGSKAANGVIIITSKKKTKD